MFYSATDYSTPIKQLEDRLDEARQAVIDLLPEELQRIARSYFSCDDEAAFHAWRQQLIDQVLSLAVILSREEGSYSGPRAYCPLCGAGSSDPYSRGFAHPEGLLRHLEDRGNTGYCSPVRVLIRQGRDYLRPQFEEQRERAEAERRRILEERHRTETLFTVEFGVNRVIDEKLPGYGDKPVRDEASLAWAAERLLSLGFEEQRTGNARAFIKRIDGHVLYADPRELGGIRFTIYQEEALLPKKRRRDYLPDSQFFDLTDRRRNNLDAALAEKVAEAVTTLAYRKRRGRR